MTNEIEAIREFRKKFLLGVGSENVNVALHKTLIKEEFYELMESIDEEDDANTLKEFVDLIYVIGGYLIDKGIERPLDAMFRAVKHNNLAKLGDGGIPMYRDDGKLMKPNNFITLNPSTVVDEYHNERFF